MNQIERFAQLQRQDREQNLIFERMSEAATPAYASVIKSTLTAPTERMIQEYNAKNQQVPVVINDPITGEPTKFKFHPVEIEPELEAEVSNEDEEISLYEAQQYKEFIASELPKIIKERDRINDQRIEFRALYDNGDITEQEYNDDIDAINASVAELNQLIEQYESDIPMVNAEILQNLQEMELIKGRNMVIREENKGKNKLLFDELNRLNSGAFNMAQLPYETEEDYKKRLIAHSQIETPAQVLYDASIFAQKDFRSRLRELLNDESLIESITNSFKPEELSKLLSRWGAIQKRWLEIFGKNNEYIILDDILTFLQNPMTKSDFESTVLAKNLDAKAVPEVDNFTTNVPERGLLNIINTKTGLSLQIRLTPDRRILKFGVNNEGEVELPTQRRTEAIRDLIGTVGLNQNEFLKAIQSDPKDLSNMKNMIKNIIRRYPEIIKEPEPEPEPAPMGLLTKTALKMSKEKPIKLSKERESEFSKAMALTIERDKRDKSRKERQEAIKLDEEARELEDYMKKIGQIPEPIEVTSKTKSKKDKRREKKAQPVQSGQGLGYGIKNILPKKIEFGALTINSGKLWDEHTLSVRDKNGYMVHGMPSAKISNEFVEIILKIVKGDKITQHEIKSLKIGERELYDLLLEKARIIKELPNTKTDTIAELRTKFNVLQGEYEAGNTNTELITDLIKTAKKLHMLKVITGKQLKEFVTQFN
jgi:hypothetical protein